MELCENVCYENVNFTSERDGRDKGQKMEKNKPKSKGLHEENTEPGKVTEPTTFDPGLGVCKASSCGHPKRRISSAVLFLVLLCVVLLAALIALGILNNQFIKNDRDQLQIKYNNMTQERDRLRISYSSMTRERDQLNTSYTNLTRERDQLNTSYTNLTRERDQLNNSYTNLTRERDQLNTSYTILTKERDDLKRRLCVIASCPSGWLKFGCSCYYIYTAVKKNWTDSKQDCSNRDADLVIINSPEEQEFLNNLTRERQINREMRVWIGLTDAGKEGTFIWVDGTPLATPKYWYYPNPDNYLYPDRPGHDEDCVQLVYMPAYVTPPLTWNDWLCDQMSNWVCEKEI